jgi:hypothetical protein
MRGNLDFRTIFPIKDAASAHLMLRKAEYLYQAGVIDRAERQVVAALFVDFIMRRGCSGSTKARNAYRSEKISGDTLEVPSA